MDPRLLVGGREPDGESISAERRLARIQKHDIVRHQGEQADKIAGVDCINPSCVHLTDSSFIRSHLQPPLPNQFDHATLGRRPWPVRLRGTEMLHKDSLSAGPYRA